jgi:DNA polymerase III delta prime subunit
MSENSSGGEGPRVEKGNKEGFTQNVPGSGNIFTGSGDIHFHSCPGSALNPEERRWLLDLCKVVESTWIKNVLGSSLHAAASIELRKTLRPELVQGPWEDVSDLARPWSQTFERPTEPSRLLPFDQKICDTFEDSSRFLLILGEPGSGKTTTLLELARDLIRQFENDPTRISVPVVLNLSTWGEKRESIRSWIVGELIRKYRKPSEISRSWLQHGRLFFLLDGLDEVPFLHREDCVRAINEFCESGVAGMVVCSRRFEYTSLPKRLRFGGALCIEPLATRQVEDFLQQAGDRLAGLRDALSSDPDLKELARSPLMLGVMSLAYENVSVNSDVKLTGGTAEQRRERIFSVYVNRMLFGPKNVGRHFVWPDRIKTYLTWLARGMGNRSTIFSVEELQPSWLSDGQQRFIYLFASRLLSGLVCGTCLAVFAYAVNFGLILSMLIVVEGTLSGCLAAYLDLRRLRSNSSNGKLWSKLAKNALALCPHLLVGACLFGAFGILIGSPLEAAVLDAADRVDIVDQIGFSDHWARPFVSCLTSLVVGSYVGLLFGIIFVPKTQNADMNSDIRLRVGVELARSTKKLYRATKIAFVYGVIFGVAQALLGFIALNSIDQKLRTAIVKWNPDPKDIVGGLMLAGSFWGVAFVVLRGIISTLVSFTGIGRRLITKPGGGVGLTAKRALLTALVVGIVAMSLVVPAGSLVKPILSMRDLLRVGGCFVAIPAGLCAGMWNGGYDVLKHFALRMQLRISGYIPQKYVRFLDHATRLILLRNVGYGYIFIHPLFLEFFSKRPDN